jgi:hypothetical protein
LEPLEAGTRSARRPDITMEMVDKFLTKMEAAMLAPHAEVSMFPWKEPKERIPLAVRQIRSFLRARRPASA